MIGIVSLVMMVLIDAGVLIFLLKTINNEDVEFNVACVVALCAAIGTSVLAGVLGAFVGTAGALGGVVIAAVLLGVAVSALFGVEIKRSILIGVLFTVAHIAVSVGFQLVFRV